ncbi:Tn3 family transposase (plasmid) [Streptomyces goshikiensis]|uniref:Tn3 family transposase n=1 Tax=Streptomyces goshikiensis TaxID=1942 RepID=UPI002F9188AF|nr:Tn3 family transposase [Streptomyces goshikiensis]
MLGAEPAAHLPELAGALHGAYHQVVAGLPGNTALSVKGGKLSLDRLGPAEPKLIPAFRQLASNMLPKVDFSELLLEVADLTGVTSAFTHIPSAGPSTEEFDLSICALLLSEACNVGLTPADWTPPTRSRHPSTRTWRRAFGRCPERQRPKASDRGEVQSLASVADETAG